MSNAAWFMIGLVAVLALSELARRLERTNLRVYLRSMKKPPEPNHYHGLGFGVSASCSDTRCPEWRQS